MVQSHGARAGRCLTLDAGLASGLVASVRGAVVDVDVAGGALPPIDTALLVDWDRPETLVLEVHSHVDTRTVRGIAMQATAGLSRGTGVRATGQAIAVPVGEAVLGRLLDVLGTLGHRAGHHRPRPGGPAGADRAGGGGDAVALGRGQRELIIGDRAIGKTTIGIDSIINQTDSDIVRVYVAIGQKSSAVRRAIGAIEAYGAADCCILVAPEASDSPGLQWIAPFAAMTMAEYFRDRGQHALIVMDDLTKHAATHREIALLTRQSPGREAYPGDVFYVHARLLERAAKLSKEKGGGSLTALPIAETDAGNLSTYVPTNLISITDGQIVLDAKLFTQGQKPAVALRDAWARAADPARQQDQKSFASFLQKRRPCLPAGRNGHDRWHCRRKLTWPTSRFPRSPSALQPAASRSVGGRSRCAPERVVPGAPK